MICLNETNLKGTSKPEVPGYYPFNRNRKGRHGGGICTLVRDSHLADTLKVREGSNEDEIIVTRHAQFQIPLNIINIYGEQESRTSKERLEENWDNILEIIDDIERKGEYILIQGDMNKHIDREVTKDVKDKLSIGGQLIIDLLETGKY